MAERAEWQRGKQVQPRALAALAYDAGVEDAHELVVAVAVALSESQGWSGAFNDNKRQLWEDAVKVDAVVCNAETLQPFTVVSKSSSGVVLRDEAGHEERYPVDASVVISRDVGCWQINIPAEKIGTATETNLQDPTKNAAAMYGLFNSRRWQPWAAFNSNVYLHDSYLRRAALGVMNHLAEILVLQARAVGQTPATRIPMISSHDLAKIYP